MFISTLSILFIDPINIFYYFILYISVSVWFLLLGKDDMKFFKKITISLSLILVLFSASCSANVTKKIPYTEAGQGEALVLIHAFPTDQQLWMPQLEGLKQHFHVITLDLWGFGQAEATDGKAVTMSDYADEVKQLLDQLKIKKAIVCGESMGGYIALAFLQKYPDAIDGLVLSDTQSIADTAEIKVKREATAEDVLAHGSSQFIAGFMHKALSPSAPAQTKTFLQNILTAQAPTSIASGLRGMALRDDTSNVLASTTLPILILTGDQDILISPQQSQAMHVLAKNSKLITIANAGHLSSLEQPDAWNKAVINMFANAGK